VAKRNQQDRMGGASESAPKGVGRGISTVDPLSESVSCPYATSAELIPTIPESRSGQSGDCSSDFYSPLHAKSSRESVGGSPPIPNALRVRWRSAWEVNYQPTGGSAQETILGADERIQQERTERYPWSAIASLQVIGPGGVTWSATGFFVSPCLLLTAGHCVFGRNQGETLGWAESIQIFPGRNGASAPFGSLSHRRVFSTKGWVQDGRSEFDYGAIAVHPTDLRGRSPGFLGLRLATNDELRRSPVTVAGYPADQGLVGGLYFDVRTLEGLSPWSLTYEADTTAGQSGGPIFRSQDQVHEVVGIHTTGGEVSNWGLRLNQDMWKNIQTWIAEAERGL
jgi:glutamyl endopeptidase